MIINLFDDDDRAAGLRRLEERRKARFWNRVGDRAWKITEGVSTVLCFVVLPAIFVGAMAFTIYDSFMNWTESDRLAVLTTIYYSLGLLVLYGVHYLWGKYWTLRKLSNKGTTL